jgi:hypothetical protein
MSLSPYTDVLFTRLNAVSAGISEARQEDRILAALGIKTGGAPKVDGKMLSRYFGYLSANLQFPFVAHYPAPTNPREERDFRCVVLGLLDPQRHAGDEIDGLFCKTRKGKYELNLPLIELDIPPKSPNFQLIEDYWYWLWNWW